MLAQFCPSPTIAEAQALASISKTAPLKYETVLASLREVLSFCQSADVHGFLFTPEPIQLSHFLSPNLMDACFSGTILATRIEPGQVMEATSSDHADGTFALFPAFSSAQVSYGFGVHEIVYSPANAWGADMGYASIGEHRYVKDYKKGILFDVNNAEEQDVIKIQHLQVLSTSCQFRIVLCFHRKKFLAVTANGMHDVRGILDTMFHLQTGMEYRPCPLCSDKLGTCRCEMTIKRPRHPLDRVSLLGNVGIHMGSFQGPAHSCFLRRGRFMQSVSLGTRVTLGRNQDDSAGCRFRNWVIRRHCKNQHPLHSHLSCSQLRNGGRVGGGGSGSGSGSGAGCSEENGSCLTLAVSTQATVHDGQCQGADDAGGGHAVGFNNSRCSSKRAETETMRRHGHAQGLDILPDVLGRFGSTGIEAGTLQQFLPEPHMEDVDGPEVRRARDGDEAHGWDEVDRAEAVGNSEAVGGEEEVQRRKEERRKEQNRMSARKSNLKKKAVNDALKQSVRETHDRAAQLRAHELRLRRENLALRQQLGEELAADDGGG